MDAGLVSAKAWLSGCPRIVCAVYDAATHSLTQNCNGTGVFTAGNGHKASANSDLDNVCELVVQAAEKWD